MTHKTSRHTICDINQRRSSKATASRFQWRPDLLWGGECRQEARGGATPGRTLLRVCAIGSGRIHEHTSSIFPPNANVKNQRETLGNLAAGELAAGWYRTRDRGGDEGALARLFPRVSGRWPGSPSSSPHLPIAVISSLA